MAILALSTALFAFIQFPTSGCPDGYELKSAKWYNVNGQMRLHCDFAGFDNCCKKVFVAVPKTIF